MKKFILTSAFVLSLGVFTSCSVDELEQPEDSRLNKTAYQINPSNNNERIEILEPIDTVQIKINIGLDIDPPIPYPKPQ